jgi:general secretion pathway protein A
MYLEHYGLKEPPFSITPDPRFVFLSERHRDALAHLLFGIGQGGGGGFVQLTGEVGTGKTTLCRLLLEQLPESTRVALVLNPRLTPVELLETICEELHLDLDAVDGMRRRGSVKALVDALNTYLLDAYAQGLRVVLIIDEAQDLSIDALEQVRLLTNLETDTQKLLQIILLGQPELRELLARDELRQLAQRITARFHLTPLDATESERYLRHRYAIAGGIHLPFDKSAIRRLHTHAGGVPRLINVIAERSLLAGYARDANTLDARIVDLAAREALPPVALHESSLKWALASVPILALVLLAIFMFNRAPQQQAEAAPARATVAPTTPASVTTRRAPPPVLDAPALAARMAAKGSSPLPAWQALLVQWQLPTDFTDVAIAAQCAPTLAEGVYCLRGRGSLDKLSAIGRPVLLHLRDGDAEAWALLLGSDALHVRLRLGDDIVDTDRVTLQRVWNGDYAALWRAAPGLAMPLVPERDAVATAWVRERVAPQAAMTAAIPLSDEVRRFQSAHGLVADAVIGPETLFALAANDPGPHLLRTLD